MGGTPEGLHDPIDVLVGDEPSHRHEILPSGGFLRMEPVDVDRRRNHGGGAPIDRFDSPGHKMRIGHEGVGPLARPEIPSSERRKKQGGGGPLRAARESPGKIRLRHVPQVPRRRVAITEMDLPRRGQDSLGHGVARGQDQIIPGKVEGFNGEGHQGKEVPVDLLNARNPSQEGLA